MRFTFFPVVVLLVTFIGGAYAEIPGDVAEFNLSNGIHVITRTLDNNEIEGFSFFLIGGSAVLTRETQGLERFALECAMTGSESYPGPELRELMDRSRAEWTGTFNYDYSRYHLRCIEEDFGELLLAFGDCLMRPEMDEEAVERVRIRRMEDLLEEKSDPDRWIWHVANDAFMPEDHTYRMLPDGTPETLAGFSADDARRMLDHRVRAGNILLVHAGPTDPRELTHMLERAFGGISEGEDIVPPLEPFSISRDTVVLEPRETETAFAVVKFNAPPRNDPDYMAFRFAMSLVSDILWQVLRTEHALTYSTYAGVSSYRRNWGYMYVSSPDPAAACSLMADVMAGVIENPVDEDLVRGMVETELTSMKMALAKKENQCWIMGEGYMRTGDWGSIFDDMEKASSLTAGDLSRVLRRWVGKGGWGVIADTSLVPVESIRPWPLEGGGS